LKVISRSKEGRAEMIFKPRAEQKESGERFSLGDRDCLRVEVGGEKNIRSKHMARREEAKSPGAAGSCDQEKERKTQQHIGKAIPKMPKTMGKVGQARSRSPEKQVSTPGFWEDRLSLVGEGGNSEHTDHSRCVGSGGNGHGLKSKADVMPSSKAP